ncbi:MAG: hypothetical protein WBA89_03085 [Microcoleus sp.]|uniref:hypothetical protein n=1 Tax=Microcoleus sp. TaxID=44472 RepID=UPI003C747F09
MADLALIKRFTRSADTSLPWLRWKAPNFRLMFGLLRSICGVNGKWKMENGKLTCGRSIASHLNC